MPWGKILFHVLGWVITPSSFLGLVHSLVKGMHEFFGMIKVGPLEWAMIFQSCVLTIIVLSWSKIVKRWKRYTKRDKHEELQLIVGKFLAANKLISAHGEAFKYVPRNAKFEYERIKRDFVSKLWELNFVFPDIQDRDDHEFTDSLLWLAHNLSVDLQNTKYDKLLNLWQQNFLEESHKNP